MAENQFQEEESGEQTESSELMQQRLGLQPKVRASVAHGPAPRGRGQDDQNSRTGDDRVISTFLLVTVLVTALVVVAAWVWHGYTSGNPWVLGRIAEPSRVGPIGDFIAGTLGVAATLAAAFLGIRLAQNALAIAKRSAATAEFIQAAETSEDRRDIERLVREEVRTTATKFEDVARAFAAVFSGAGSLHSLGRLRDSHAKETIPEAEARIAELKSQIDAFEAESGPSITAPPTSVRRRLERLHGELEAEEARLAKARADEADLVMFPLEEFDRFLKPMEAMAKAVEELYWHVPAREIVNGRAGHMRSLLEAICRGREEPPFPTPDLGLLPFSLVQARKSKQAGNELPFVKSSAEMARSYDRYVSRVVDQAYQRASTLQERDKVLIAQGVIPTASVGMSFWSTTVSGAWRYQANWGLLMLLLAFEAMPSNGELRQHCESRFKGLVNDTFTASDLDAVLDAVLAFFDLDDWKRAYRISDLMTIEEIRQIIFYDPEETAKDLLRQVKGALAASAAQSGEPGALGGGTDSDAFAQAAAAAGVDPVVSHIFFLTQAWQNAQSREIEDEALMLATDIYLRITDIETRRLAAGALAGPVVSHLARVLQSGQPAPTWLLDVATTIGDVLPDEDKARYEEVIREITSNGGPP